MTEGGGYVRLRGMRVLAAIVTTVAAFAVLAAFGGLGGIAATGTSAAAEYQYGDGKVTMCHRTGSGKKQLVTVMVDASAVDTMLARGDTLGPCP